jgi:hypothetical protein
MVENKPGFSKLLDLYLFEWIGLMNLFGTFIHDVFVVTHYLNPSC